MKTLKGIKIAQYILSFAHLVFQIFYFLQWDRNLDAFSSIVKQMNVEMMANVNLVANQQSFIYIGLSLITLAFYITISNHLSIWASEKRFEHNMKEKASK